jgi:alkyldihydroxyacetonephosphate synthase
MLEEFQRIGIRTSQTLGDRVSYARDLWPRNHLAVRAGNVGEHKPAGVVWPETTEHVVRIVELCSRRGVPLVPFGAGSGVCGGVLPSADMVVVDLKRMDRWRRFDPEIPLLDVEAGHMGVPLEEKLNARNMTLGHFPSSILCSTSGGWIAARSAGQCSGRYGKIEDMVVSLECVTGAGDVVTLHQRSHGPSLVPIVVGSEGTLAIVTSSTLRLHPLASRVALGAWSVPTMKRGWEAMRAIFQSGLRPAVSRLYDPFDAMLARQKKSGKKTKRSAPGASSAALRTLLRKPGLFNALLESQVAGRAMGGALLVIIFEGDTADDDMRKVRDMMAAHGATDEGEGPARHWLERRYAVSYRQSPVLMSGLFVDTMEVAASWSSLESLYDGVRLALGPDVFVMAHMSHAYPDGCCIYFSFAGAADPRSGDWDAACERRYDRAWRSALAAAVASGGTIAHHHGVGRSKAPALRGEIGSSGIDVFRHLKRAFDPAGILNPGALDASRS